MLQKLTSAKYIEKRFYTGEEPVLVECNDKNAYICKYSRYTGSANKLVCELLGSLLAKDWMLFTPDVAIVKVLPIHVPQSMAGSLFTLPTIGSRMQYHCIDITPSSVNLLPQENKLLKQLVKIALFDFWIANEDRNANNANLMYDVLGNNIIAIDFGCSFNTATLEFPLSQLTETDSILSSDLFKHLKDAMPRKEILAFTEILINIDMPSYIHDVKTTYTIVSMWEQDDPMYISIPKEWNINKDTVTNKLEELLNEEWIQCVKENFMNCLMENLKDE